MVRVEAGKMAETAVGEENEDEDENDSMEEEEEEDDDVVEEDRENILPQVKITSKLTPLPCTH